MAKGGESELIAWLARQPLKAESLSFVKCGIGDDMALLAAGGDVLITSDMLLDGVHFDRNEHDLDLIGRKAIACGLSDCAAIAVKPLAATVSVSQIDKLRVA